MLYSDYESLNNGVSAFFLKADTSLKLDSLPSNQYDFLIKLCINFNFGWIDPEIYTCMG